MLIIKITNCLKITVHSILLLKMNIATTVLKHTIAHLGNHGGTQIWTQLGNKYFEFKKLVGRQGAPELELLAVVIVMFAPILHETLTNSNFDTNTICQLSHGSSF